ncbi:MAG TPA: D-isomer specific 2-hydroxyacid dehydrogenase family protein [Bryobacterales bacterium]|nr:D-isomer specific 2-hydroxyacid dehydrogenase family protein [Bryobacterales bacterium]
MLDLPLRGPQSTMAATPRIHAISLAPMSAAQKARLKGLGELRYFDAVLGDLRLAEQCRGAEILIVTPRLHLDIVPYLDGCRFISVQGAGTDALDVVAARGKGILVSNVPDFCSDAVAEHAFALLLAVAKNLEAGRATLQQSRWQTALAYPTIGLKGQTLGLFGCGKIGSRIAALGRAFGMRVLATTRSPRGTHFEQLLAESDFLVIAAPATPETRGRFNAAAFAAMKPGAVLVNISRAALVDDGALLAALDTGRLAGAAVDVFSHEPPPPDHPLLHHPRLLVSPHVAWGTADAVERLLDLSIENVEAFLSGRPIHLVEP